MLQGEGDLVRLAGLGLAATIRLKWCFIGLAATAVMDDVIFSSFGKLCYQYHTLLEHIQAGCR